MKRAVLCAAIVAAGFPAMLGAAEAPLGCEELVAEVLAGDPALRAAEAAVREAEAGTGLASWLSPPELRGRRDLDTRNDQTRLGLRLALPEPGVAVSKASAARAREESAEADLQVRAAKTAAAVRVECAGLRHARARLRALEHLAEGAAAHLRAVRTRTTAGIVTALAEESAALEMQEAEAELAEARGREEEAAAAMIRWSPRPLASDGPACEAPAAAALDDDLLARHPEVRAARQAAEAAESAAAAARRERWPWPSFVQVSWLREEKDRDQGLIVEAGVPLPWPAGDAAESEARAQMRRFEAQVVERRVRAEIEAAIAARRSVAEELRRLEAEEETIRRARNLASAGTRAGADADEVWRLEQRIAERQQRLDAVRYQAELRAIELRRALGMK